jgi:phage I-like protein
MIADMKQTLASILNARIRDLAPSPEEETALVARMAEAAGIEPGTVRQILNGDIDTPPDERLRGFAQVLDVAFDSLRNAVAAPRAEAQASRVMMAAREMVGAEGAEAPEWVHLLPAGRVETFDGRGPYEIADMQAVIEQSMSQRGDLEIDINHASFLSAPKGGDARAVGWITEMQARTDGIWGRVKWTEEGRQLVGGRAYRRISPVINYIEQGGKKIVAGILNASLANRQNLRGLVALNIEETEMSFSQRLAKALGLSEEADEEAILAKIASMTTAAAQSETIGKIGVALGLSEDADADAVLNAARERATTGEDGELITALQADLTKVTGELATLKTDRQRERAEAVVDAAMSDRRAGINATSRERIVSMHMSDPQGTEEFIAGLPKLGASGMDIVPPAAKDGSVALNAEQTQVAAQLGISVEEYSKALADEQKELIQ